jgi:hypothetical protein
MISIIRDTGMAYFNIMPGVTDLVNPAVNEHA